MGLTVDQLRGSRFTRLRRDCYVRSDAARDRDGDIRAVMAVMPDHAALYGTTAAEWYELPTATSDEVHVIVPGRGPVPRRRPGVVTHEGLGVDESTTVRGVRVSTPERTWLDLSLVLAPRELIVVGDAMVKAGLTTSDRLVAAADGARGRRNVIDARSAARRVCMGVDSPQETRLRLTLVDGGLGAPEVNPDLADAAGGWIGRPDLAYPEVKVAIQYEGDVHRVDKSRWRADIARDAVLADHGWEVVRVTAADLSRPWLLCDRIRRAMERQRVRLAGA